MIDENNEIEKEKSPEDNSSADISLPKQVKEKVLEKAFGPAAEEFGVGIRPVGQDAAKIVVGTVKTAKVLLSPIYGMVWGAEKIWKWINEEVERRLEGIEEAERISPDPQIAGPTIEAMRFIGEKDQLRSMFANLLATSMNRSTADSAHPSFVEVLKQITPEEAKIIEYFATHDGEPIVEIRAFDKDEKSHNYKIILSKFSTLPDKIGIDNPDIFGSYIDNLCRLELVSVPKGISIADDSAYDEIREHQLYKSINDLIEKNGKRMKIDKGVIKKTDFGDNFIKACVLARK